MSRHLERLLQLDSLLRIRQRPTTLSLAKELEVSERTIRSDLAFLRDRIARETGDRELHRLILGVELIHAEKVGNNIKIRSISTVDPTIECIDKYEAIKKLYWCPF